MFWRHLICVLSAVALASARFKPADYVNGAFRAMKANFTERGAMNWALDPRDIIWLGPEENITIAFFRAYVSGLEDLVVEEDCSMSNSSHLVDIECLVKFPSVLFTAHGNMKEISRPLIKIKTPVQDLLAILKIEKNNGTRLTKFDVVSIIHLDFEAPRERVPRLWEGGVQEEVRKWVQAKITEVVRGEINTTLDHVVSQVMPMP